MNNELILKKSQKYLIARKVEYKQWLRISFKHLIYILKVSRFDVCCEKQSNLHLCAACCTVLLQTGVYIRIKVS